MRFKLMELNDDKNPKLTYRRALTMWTYGIEYKKCVAEYHVAHGRLGFVFLYRKLIWHC